MTDAVALLLAAALQHSIDEPSIEAGFTRFQSIVGGPIDYDGFPQCGECLSQGWPDSRAGAAARGALHCRWQLELTVAGAEMASARGSVPR